jgi:hypothetical protein
MKTLQLNARMYSLMLVTTLFSGILLISCSDSGKERANKQLNEFRSYVKEKKESTEEYTEEKWENVESDYNRKKAELEKDADKLDKDMKQSYANSVAEWEEFKHDVAAKKEARQREKAVADLKKTIAPDYVMTDMSNITGKNIAEIYTYFYRAVEKNKDVYTKEEWTTVNDYWKNLNDIKDRLDNQKAISKADNKTINEIRVKYAATKALNKPFAEKANS